jgi:hypothetical protein
MQTDLRRGAGTQVTRNDRQLEQGDCSLILHLTFLARQHSHACVARGRLKDGPVPSVPGNVAAMSRMAKRERWTQKS